MLLTDVEGPVTTLTLNDPARRNPLSIELMSRIMDELRNLDASCEVVVIAANGPAFSAGHYIGEMIDRDPAFYAEVFEVCTAMMDTIHAIQQPVIAKVQGIATAAGCQLVAACDLAVASQDSLFATPGLKIGLFCSTPMVPISRAIGRKRAMEMLLTAEPINANTAAEWGLINRVVPSKDLDDEVQGLTDQITRFSSTVVGLGKSAFYSQIEVDEHSAYDLTQSVMTANATLKDAQEGMTAFLEKREPEWQQ